MDRESHVLRQSYDKLQKTLGGLETERDGYKRDKFQGESQRNELCEAGLIQKGETPVAAQY